jgi:hypothetical protein
VHHSAGAQSLPIICTSVGHPAGMLKPWQSPVPRETQIGAIAIFVERDIDQARALPRARRVPSDAGPALGMQRGARLGPRVVGDLDVVGQRRQENFKIWRDELQRNAKMKTMRCASEWGRCVFKESA